MHVFLKKIILLSVEIYERAIETFPIFLSENIFSQKNDNFLADLYTLNKLLGMLFVV